LTRAGKCRLGFFWCDLILVQNAVQVFQRLINLLGAFFVI
jgi:hypothetical protein